MHFIIELDNMVSSPNIKKKINQQECGYFTYQLVHSNALHLQILKASPMQCKSRKN